MAEVQLTVTKKNRILKTHLKNVKLQKKYRMYLFSCLNYLHLLRLFLLVLETVTVTPIDR